MTGAGTGVRGPRRRSGAPGCPRSRRVTGDAGDTVRPDWARISSWWS
ncbi:hypothetical protein EES45_15790 [Streptomyces sp. ADI97-07]|nr:hypothetical protein EES45_15790 [Streptomyces sp. ADI97-07]